MADDSYDLISEPLEPPRTRFGRRPVPPRAGIAYVFITSDGRMLESSLYQPNGEDWTSRRLQTMYEVDVSEHLLEFGCKLPCLQDVGHFLADIHLAWKVDDPLEVVRRNLRDAPGELRPWVIARMHEIAEVIDVRERAFAQKRINDELGVAKGVKLSIGLEICRLNATLTLDQAASEHVAHLTTIIRGEEADQRKQQSSLARKEHWQQAIAGGYRAFLPAYLAEHPEHAGRVLDLLRADEVASLDRNLAAFRAMLDADVMDESDLHQWQGRVLDFLETQASLRKPEFGSIAPGSPERQEVGSGQTGLGGHEEDTSPPASEPR